MREPSLGVDTESNSFFVYRERTCLVQVSSMEADWVIDPFAVDISPMGELLANPAIEKIFHACEFDVLSLKRDYRFTFANVFDTHPSVDARVAALVQYAGGHDPGPLALDAPADQNQIENTAGGPWADPQQPGQGDASPGPWSSEPGQAGGKPFLPGQSPLGGNDVGPWGPKR